MRRSSKFLPGAIDIDECNVWYYQCPSNSRCKNTPGSYECHCNTGFRPRVTTSRCHDVNECATAATTSLATSVNQNAVERVSTTTFMSLHTILNITPQAVVFLDWKDVENPGESKRTKRSEENVRFGSQTMTGQSAPAHKWSLSKKKSWILV